MAVLEAAVRAIRKKMKRNGQQTARTQIVMNVRKSVASHDYERKLVDSGIERAYCGRKELLNGARLTVHPSEVNRKALKLATIGLCIGVVASCLDRRHKSAGWAVAGGAVGFAASVAWSGFTLAETVARAALKNLAAVRDQQWLKSHPIDYA